LEISSTSSPFIRVAVSARVVDGFEDVTTGTPSMCFKAVGTGEPATIDFGVATWETGGPPYFMRRIATGLTDGRYDIWSRVQLGAEDVREKVGVLVVT
jgi:hypothetical protein